MCQSKKSHNAKPRDDATPIVLISTGLAVAAEFTGLKPPLKSRRDQFKTSAWGRTYNNATTDVLRRI